MAEDVDVSVCVRRARNSIERASDTGAVKSSLAELLRSVQLVPGTDRKVSRFSSEVLFSSTCSTVIQHASPSISMHAVLVFHPCTIF